MAEIATNVVAMDKWDPAPFLSGPKPPPPSYVVTLAIPSRGGGNCHLEHIQLERNCSSHTNTKYHRHNHALTSTQGHPYTHPQNLCTHTHIRTLAHNRTDTQTHAQMTQSDLIPAKQKLRRHWSAVDSHQAADSQRKVTTISD